MPCKDTIEFINSYGILIWYILFASVGVMSIVYFTHDSIYGTLWLHVQGFQSLRICADLQDFCRSLQICADSKKTDVLRNTIKTPQGCQTNIKSV